MEHLFEVGEVVLVKPWLETKRWTDGTVVGFCHDGYVRVKHDIWRFGTNITRLNPDDRSRIRKINL